MHGNVSEWCLDWFAPYPDGSEWNPVGPDKPASGYGRVKRGGSYNHNSSSCRSATRFTGSASEVSQSAGFRVACPAEAKAVQLWEGGPRWAEKNIGAEAPEDYGLYFWWGDTIGYKWENDTWGASDGSVTNFEFTQENTPNYGLYPATLKSEGWITAEGDLDSKYDAAQTHWGDSWRMPTRADVDALTDNCDLTWTTQNGVNGYVIRGRGDYADNSIFLPAAGNGILALFRDAGLRGIFWLSTLFSASNSTCADSFRMVVGSGYHIDAVSYRYGGNSVRPVQDPAE